MLIWKGNSAIPTKIEELLIEQVIKEYYEAYFVGFKGYNKSQIDALHKKFLIETATEGKPTDTNKEVEERIWKKIKEMEDRRKALVVDELSFNSFFEYSTERIPYICNENKITGIDLSSYNYSLSEFYRGGTYERTLNENIDSSLFDETFIVLFFHKLRPFYSGMTGCRIQISCSCLWDVCFWSCSKFLRAESTQNLIFQSC